MPTNLSEIKQLYTDWYLLALDNPLFVAVLVVVVWILVAIIYNFKILFLTKKLKASEQVQLATKNTLAETEQQVAQLEEKIASDIEQQAKDKQAFIELQDKQWQRKQIMMTQIKSIAEKFDLSEQLVEQDKEMTEEFIWQQQDNIIQQLTDRLNVTQQKIAHSKDKDSLISHLQGALDAHTEQFTQLVQAIAEQKQTQLQQQKELQQQLSTAFEQQKLSRVQNKDKRPDQPRSSIDKEKSQQENIPEEPVQQSELTAETLIEEQQIIGFNELESAMAETVDAVEVLSEEIETDESVVQQELVREQENKDNQVAESEIIPSVQEDNDVHELLNLAEPVFSAQLDNNALDQQAFATEAAPAPEPVPKTSTEANQAVAGKFKNLLGKVKSSKRRSEPEQKIETFESVEIKPSKTQEAPLGQQIESFTAEEHKELEEEEEPHVEPDYGASNFKVPGMFKKLLAKGK